MRVTRRSFLVGMGKAAVAAALTPLALPVEDTQMYDAHITDLSFSSPIPDTNHWETVVYAGMGHPTRAVSFGPPSYAWMK